MNKDKILAADHLPLEEVMIAEIEGIEAPEGWHRAPDDKTPDLPPVVVEENRGFLLVGNHRTVWHLKQRERTMVKCLVVRGTVHVKPAHSMISNCAEEALLFEAILRHEIVPNRSRLAEMLGYSRARITQLLNLLKLPSDLRQKVLMTDGVSEFQLRQLLKLIGNPEKLHAAFDELMENKLSGRKMALYTESKQATKPKKEFEQPEKTEDVLLEEHDDTDTLSELEEVFSQTLKESAAQQSDTNHKRNESEALEHHEPEISTERHTVEDQKPDMKKVIREIGNLRASGWQARAAEYMLPPLEMKFLEGVSLLRSGLYTKAIDILEEVVVKNPSHHLASYYLGRCANLSGTLQEAEEYLRNAIALGPEDADYFVELAVVLEKLKRHTEAETFYRKAALIRRKALIGG